MLDNMTPYAICLEDDGQEEITAKLIDQIGQTVCVAWVLDRQSLRNNFEPQISVQGKLEGSVKSGRYRVLVDDNNYSYFYKDNVWSVGQDVGKRAVIFIGGKYWV